MTISAKLFTFFIFYYYFDIYWFNHPSRENVAMEANSLVIHTSQFTQPFFFWKSPH